MRRSPPGLALLRVLLRIGPQHSSVAACKFATSNFASGCANSKSQQRHRRDCGMPGTDAEEHAQQDEGLASSAASPGTGRRTFAQPWFDASAMRNELRKHALPKAASSGSTRYSAFIAGGLCGVGVRIDLWVRTQSYRTGNIFN